MKEKVSLIRRAYRKILYSDIDKVYKKHLDQVKLPRNRKKVLDVGMGYGFDLISKHRKGYDCYGVEYDRTRVEKTKEIFEKHGLDATLKAGTATKIPFGNGFFDEVICSHVIEHVKDDMKCLKEIYRVLKKGGTLYLRVPHVNNLYTKFHMKIHSESPYTDRTHVREYDRGHLEEILTSSGFDIKKIEMSGFFLPVGLKFFMIADHYLSTRVLMQSLGEMFPENAAEIKVVAKK